MTDQGTSRDAANWAENVHRLRVTDDVKQYGYNIDGRRVSGPQQGFGRLWRRTWTTALGSAVTPEALITRWRAEFGSFWPATGTFHAAAAGIVPGAVTPLNSGPIATGILVLYSDATSFSFITPEGHFFAGIITFSAEQDAEWGTIAKIHILVRASDPLFEATWALVGRGEAAFWAGTLKNLAAAYGVTGATVGEVTECVDRRRIWKNWRNISRNPVLRSMGHFAAAPFRARPKSEPAK